MSNVQVRTLGGITAPVLTEASNAAFADYPVSVQMTVGQMETLLRQNDVRLDLSAGLFDGDRLVGFWLNGIRAEGGRVRGYDGGTAILEDYRGRGYSGALAEAVEPLLIGAGVGTYVLEVLAQNETAFRIYRKQGFEVRRRLRCLRTTEPPAPLPPPADSEIAEGPLDPRRLGDLPPMEFQPSWQHELRSMLNIRSAVHAVIGRRAGRVVGYVLVMPERGRITQLGFAEGEWEGALPAALLTRACAVVRADEIAAVNVDPAAERTLALLSELGFERYAEQHEMLRTLPGTVDPST